MLLVCLFVVWNLRCFFRNIFQGGFLGLDNIGVVDRSQPFPNGFFAVKLLHFSVRLYDLKMSKVAAVVQFFQIMIGVFVGCQVE